MCLHGWLCMYVCVCVCGWVGMWECEGLSVCLHGCA